MDKEVDGGVWRSEKCKEGKDEDEEDEKEGKKEDKEIKEEEDKEVDDEEEEDELQTEYKRGLIPALKVLSYCLS